MARRHYNLPSLTMLASFEVAARNLSFKTAARELNVTPGAVSHQIKALERDIGARLFFREHRGVRLTQDGTLLFDALEKSFHDISNTLTKIRNRADDETVIIAATTAMSSLWLTPHLGKFWQAHGNIRINQIVSDTVLPFGVQVDLRLKYGTTGEEEQSATELFRDELVPLASPSFVEKHKLQTPDIPTLACLPLIHLNASDATWTTWRNWFDAQGYRGEIVLAHEVNNYMIALQAAQDGAGLVLGWRKLVSPLLADGALVELGKNTIAAPHAFYLYANRDDEMHKNARILRDWLIAQLN